MNDTYVRPPLEPINLQVVSNATVLATVHQAMFGPPAQA